MTEAIVTFPDGRRARVSGASREAVAARVQAMQGQEPGADGVGIDPNTGKYDVNLALLDRLMSGEIADSPERTRRYTASLGPLGSIRLPEGAVSGAASALANVPRETSVPIVLGTMGSIAAGPAMGAAAARQALAPVLSRLPAAARAIAGVPARVAARAAKPTAGAATGGAIAGAGLEAERPGATPGSIAGQAVETGLEMGAAELAGLGIGAAAAGVVAPASTSLGRVLKWADPLKGAREEIGSLTARLPAEARAAARRVEELLPVGAVQDAAAGLRGVAQRASDVFRQLVKADIGQSPVTAVATAAERTARALGIEQAKKFGYGAKAGAEAFLGRLVSEADDATLGRIKKYLSANEYKDFLAANLSGVISRATAGEGGKRTLNGAQLLQEWRKLPESLRAAYPETTHKAVRNLAVFGSTLSRVGRFAASPAGGEVAEALAVPIATAAFGLHVGIPLMVAKALINPGPVARYLSRDKLPSEITRMTGRQTATAGVRSQTLTERDRP